jgi:hypothetical protein
MEYYFLYKLLFVFLNSKNHLSQKIQKQKTTNRHLQRRLVCGRHFEWRLGAAGLPPTQLCSRQVCALAAV